MFEPVTMTRSTVAVVAAGAGKTFPCASRAGEADGICPERLKTMAKEIASKTETLRSNPHSRNWIFFIWVRLCQAGIQKRPDAVQCFFRFFLIRRLLSIISTTQSRQCVGKGSRETNLARRGGEINGRDGPAWTHRLA